MRFTITRRSFPISARSGPAIGMNSSVSSYTPSSHRSCRCTLHFKSLPNLCTTPMEPVRGFFTPSLRALRL